MYTVKNVRTLNTSDGIAYTATLYRDGTKIGSIENRGDGGATFIYASRADVAEFGAWGLKHFAHDGLMQDSTLDSAAEYAADLLVDDALYERKLRAESKKYVVFVQPGDDRKNVYRRFKHYGRVDDAVSALKRKVPDAIVWSPDTGWETP